MEPQNPSIDISELHKMIISTVFVTVKLWHVQLGDGRLQVDGLNIEQKTPGI